MNTISEEFIAPDEVSSLASHGQWSPFSPSTGCQTLFAPEDLESLRNIKRLPRPRKTLPSDDLQSLRDAIAKSEDTSSYKEFRTELGLE